MTAPPCRCGKSAAFFGVVALWLGVAAGGHKMQTTLTEMEWFPDRGTLEVVHSIHLDDVMVLLADLGDRAEARLITLNASALEEYRANFPCHLDADDFDLQDDSGSSPAQ